MLLTMDESNSCQSLSASVGFQLFIRIKMSLKLKLFEGLPHLLPEPDGINFTRKSVHNEIHQRYSLIVRINYIIGLFTTIIL